MLIFISNFSSLHKLTTLKAERSVSKPGNQKFIPPAFEKGNLKMKLIKKVFFLLDKSY